MQRHIIGIVGLIGSGKGTVGDYLVTNHGFKSASFAKTLKDAVSVIFGWPRNLLEGDTAESRLWREQVDAYWTHKMGRPITPRWVLQYIGTDVMRHNFHNNIWIDSLEKQIAEQTSSIVITDVRFGNEIDLIHRLNGTIVWVRKDPIPEWFDLAKMASAGDPEAIKIITERYQVHESEWAWTNCTYNAIIENNGSLAELYDNTEKWITQK